MANGSELSEMFFDFAGNQISRFHYGTDFAEKAKASNLSVDLSGNPIVCDCVIYGLYRALDTDFDAILRGEQP